MIKKDVVDNTDVTMSEVLNDNIKLATSLDISTGYFDIGGYRAVRTELEKKANDPSFQFRMLMGAEAVVKDPGFDKIRDAYGINVEHTSYGLAGRNTDDALSLKDRLDSDLLTSVGFDDVNGLIKFLERNNTQVRIGGKKFNHAKCYIFGSTLGSFVGSSNFTGAGLERNDELNAGLYQPASIQLTKEWFERVWKKAEDGKQNLIDLFKQSKFGIPPDPYHVYMKMLFEEYRDYLIDADRKGRTTIDLAKFQAEAVQNVRHMLSKFGGALIADSTGLGKTNMGIEIIRQKNDEGKKILLVAPAQVLDSMWRIKLDDAQLQPKILGLEKLSRMSVLELRKKYGKINFIIIDESQNFRNKNSNRWKNMMKLIHGIGRKKQVVMMTATPINNSIMDLYYQLCLITNEEDAFFYETTGIEDLYRHMREAADKDNFAKGLDQIQYLLGKIMVRRTRSYIKESYPDDVINGKPIMFPEHKHSPIRYSLSDIFGNIYKKIMRDFELLKGTPYCIDHYNTEFDTEKRSKIAGLGKIQTILLLKRFESSTSAITISLKNKISLYNQFAIMLEKGEILRTTDFNKIMAMYRKYLNDYDSGSGDAMIDEDEYFSREIKKIKTEKATSYDICSMYDDLKFDLQILKNMLGEVEKITPQFDKKFEAVRDAIQRDNALCSKSGERSGKVLIFSEHKPTAMYIHDRLVDTFKDHNVALIFGDTTKDDRQRIIEAFAPVANPTGEPVDPKQRIDILVSTEVMSEGQNLQDCNYVINYELPWNPMRMVQRAGRIDRLTSEYSTVFSKACYPDKDLDDLLNLNARLIRKVQVANELVGIDSPLMGEIPKAKQYTGIAQMLTDLSKDEGGDAIMSRLRDENDLMGSSLLGELTKYVKKIGASKMHNEAMGRRTGKKWSGEQKAVLAYLKTPDRTTYFVVYDYKTQNAVVASNPDDAIRLTHCKPDEPVHLPMDGPDHRESYMELLKINSASIAAIRARQEAVHSYHSKNIRRRKDAHERNMAQLKKILVEGVRTAAIDGSVAGDLMDVARSDLKVWQEEIKIILDDYKQDHDFSALVTSLDAMKGRVEREDFTNDEKTLPKNDAESKLTLIGAMFLSRDKFDQQFTIF